MKKPYRLMIDVESDCRTRQIDMVRGILDRATTICTNRQIEALELIYWQGKTFAEAGAEMGISKQRVNMLVKRALLHIPKA